MWQNRKSSTTKWATNSSKIVGRIFEMMVSISWLANWLVQFWLVNCPNACLFTTQSNLMLIFIVFFSLITNHLFKGTLVSMKLHDARSLYEHEFVEAFICYV